eukprot:1976950-Amphidinium_carterae.1
MVALFAILLSNQGREDRTALALTLSKCENRGIKAVGLSSVFVLDSGPPTNPGNQSCRQWEATTP